MSKLPLVSVVIPTHNRKKMVIRLLTSILEGTYKNIEIIVIDDASSDGTYEYISEKFIKNKRIQILRNKVNLFAAGSRNVGLKKAKGEFIFFVDDDNVLDKRAISLFVELFQKDITIGELGPVNYSYLQKKRITWLCTKRNMATSKTNQSRSIREFGTLKNWETDDVPNAYIARTSIMKKHKIFFREKYGIMYEESDLAYRIRAAGYKIKVVRGAKIYHDSESLSSDGKVKDYMYHFMEDARRPFVFARNRVVFHALYSTKIELLGIILFWMWLFTGYYIYKILFYSGAGSYSFFKRINLATQYIKGDFEGIIFALNRKPFI